MAINLISKVNEMMTGEVVRLVGRAVHGTDTQITSAADVTLAGLLDHLQKITSSRLATEALFQSVSQQDDDLLQHLPEALLGDNYKSLANSGAFALSSLLGTRTIQRLTGYTASSSGLTQQDSTTLLSILMPVVLAVIKQKLVHDNKLSSQGVSSLLSSQKDIIANSLPAALQNNDVIQHRISANEHLAQTEETRSLKEWFRIPLSLLLPILLVPVAVFMVYQWSLKVPVRPMALPDTKKTGTMTQAVDAASETTAKQVEENVAVVKTENRKDAVRLKQAEELAVRNLRVILARITRKLAAINSKNKAIAQIPELEKEVVAITKLAKKMQSMSAAVKKQARVQVQSIIPQWQGILHDMDAASGEREIIQPVVDKIIQNLVDTFI